MTSNDRTTRTPAERAQEALARQGRVVARLAEKYERLTDEAARVDDELSAARKRHEYLSQYPDLSGGPRSLAAPRVCHLRRVPRPARGERAVSLGRVGIYDAQRNLVADLGTVDSLTMVDSTTLPPTMVVTDEMQPIPPGGFVAVMDTEMGMQLVKGSATHVVYRRTEVTP